MKIDKKIIKELSDYLEEFNLTELEYTEKDTKIKVSKNNVTLSNPAYSKMIIVCPNSTGCPSSIHISLTTPSDVEGT